MQSINLLKFILVDTYILVPISVTQKHFYIFQQIDYY